MGAPDKRTAPPGRTPFASTVTGKSLHIDFDAGSQVDFQDLDSLDACLEAALDYERELFRKQLRLRRFILNLIANRDAWEDLGKAVWRWAA